MTDKQIIYDDVEVKDCIAYVKSQTVYLGNTAYKQMEKVCMVKNQPCKFFDCQFKQMVRELKRKEQKLAKIKEILEIHKDNKCVICPKFDECFEQPSCDNVILQIIEGKENE